jgi:hypothetical protein
MRFKDDYGFTGKEIEISPEEYTSGTNTIRSLKKIQELQDLATENQSNKKIDTVAKNK